MSILQDDVPVSSSFRNHAVKKKNNQRVSTVVVSQSMAVVAPRRRE